MQTFKLKPGRGKHTFRTAEGRVVLTAGQTIRCEPEELGGAIDKFIAIDKPTETPTVELVVAQTEDGYFVATAEGKAIHQGPISRDDAVNLAGEAEVVKAEDYYAEFGGLDNGEPVGDVTGEATEITETEEVTEEPTKRKKGKRRK